MDLVSRVVGALEPHPDVIAVHLAGSRGRGEATAISDWDFAVEVSHFEVVARDLPRLVAPLQPLSEQWNPLSPFAGYMLMLQGAGKVDLNFEDQPREFDPPWLPGAGTLAAIDRHFWDWIRWMAAKHHAGRHQLVEEMLDLMWRHLLGPFGVEEVPESIEDAVSAYLRARTLAEERFKAPVPLALQADVLKALRRFGYGVSN